MEKTSQQKITDIKQLISLNASIRSDIQKLLDYLPDSEYELISFMVAQQVWVGPVPPPPANYQSGDGSIELGLILYWLNNPSQLNLSYFTPTEKLEIQLLIAALDYLIAPSQMTDQNAAFFNSNELIYIDGSVLSTRKFATYDQGWFIAFLNLIETVLHNLWYSGETFPATPPPTIPISGAVPGKVTIAVLGDCGTGDATLQSIINSIELLKPDYIIHVGDVYYSGTPLSTSPSGSHYFAPGEEYKNLLALWPKSYAGRSFTLNSNHEMYSGANGYFYDALGVSNAPTPFSAQKGSSCFALQYGGWTILGLDTAYMGSTEDAFMNGTIGGANGTQGLWIKSLNLNPAKTIVLTHHNGFAADCSNSLPLWNEINGALNGDPYAWYWGHVHNGIVYKSPIAIPASSTQPGIITKTFCRCLGHAALPYGLASQLNGKPIAWCEGNLQPAPSKQLYNGFAMLTLTADSANQLNGIVETFYDVGTGHAVWRKKIY